MYIIFSFILLFDFLLLFFCMERFTSRCANKCFTIKNIGNSDFEITNKVIHLFLSARLGQSSEQVPKLIELIP